MNQRRAAFERVEKALDLSDTMKIPPAYTNTDREGQYLEGLRFGKAIMDDEVQHRHGIFDFHTHQYALGISSPYGHNPLMFGPTLALQTSPEQRARWMPLVDSGKIIGTFVQTELGHGTFVRGLETMATFDEVTDEFVINSPTLTSTKYWPSALAFTASHAIVMAKLVIKGKDHGSHPFLVQIRSMEDYKTLPGVEAGDIGSKIGFNTTDMGYAIFNNVRIPRDQMLMGHAKVLHDGTYIKPPHPKLAYTTLTYTRVCIIHVSAFQLAQAVVIASRFSVVREQGVGTATDVKQEIAIIEYKSQHYRLLTIMSQAYALLFASQVCTKAYRALLGEQLNGEHKVLPQIHALTAALKAYNTQTCLDGVEDARKCCGGFGYSDMSGFTTILSTVLPLPTLEGENYVMYQQTARYLVKGIAAFQSNNEVDDQLAYLRLPQESHCPLSTAADFLDPDNQITIFRHRAARLVFDAAALLEKAQKDDGLPYAQAWNKHMLPLVRASHAHIELFVLECFSSAVNACPDPATRQTLTHLRNLFALTAMENPAFSGAMGFVEDGYINAQHLATIRETVHGLLSNLLPDLISLGDAWDFTDPSLGSAIGMYDGNMYERLMAWTKQLPLNVRARDDQSLHRKGYDGIIEPMLKSRL